MWCYWTEINENNGVMIVSQNHAQFVQRHRVFGGSRKSKLPRDLNHNQGVSADGSIYSRVERRDCAGDEKDNCKNKDRSRIKARC